MGVQLSLLGYIDKMSTLITPAGSFTSCWVGTFGASSQLTRIPLVRTKEVNPHASTPTEYVSGLNIFVQSGDQKVEFEIHFYADTGLAIKLARCLAINETNINNVPNPARKYQLLLFNSDPTKMSYYFNEISTKLDLFPNYEKEKPTELSVGFVAQNPNLAANIISVGSATTSPNIYDLMGPVNPF